MVSASPRLDLPYLQPAQAQKHVTHNEALLRVDGAVQLAITAFDQITPPAAPMAGDTYALGALPQDAWLDQAGALAMYSDSGWVFLVPLVGWRAWDISAGVLRVFGATGWQPMITELQNLDGMGVGTTSDATNALAVAGAATLFTHAGSDHQIKLNKASTGDTATLLYQSAWSGRAEIGLAGDDDLHIKVSADGGLWHDALVIAGGDGTATGTAVQSAPDDVTAGRLMAVGAFGLGQAALPDMNGDASGLTTQFGAFDSASGPDGAGWAGMHLSLAPDQRGAQIAARTGNTANTPALALRHRDGSGDWTAWMHLIGQADLVGTVSESGGAPTGAVIETGDTADGTYLRFADGTQICHHIMSGIDIDTATGALFTHAAVTWNYPQPFAGAAPIVSGGGDTGISWLSSSAATTTAVDLALVAPVTGTANTIQVMALGRWF